MGEVTPSAGAIVVAAGAGERMGAGVPKALMPVGGRPLLAWCVDVLGAHPRVGHLVVVAPPGREVEFMGLMPDTDIDVSVVRGGSSRAHSVALGMEAIPVACELVLVHDAARPLLHAGLVDAVLDGIGDGDGAIAAAPLADTPKRVNENGVITETPARAGLWLAQTPQAFRTEAFRAAIRAAVVAERLHAATDCASLIEAVGGRVHVVANPEPNPKVTTPGDVPLAEMLLGA